MNPPAKDPRVAELVGIARELGRAAGFEAAEALMLHFGGQRLYVPAKMRPSSPFWKVLGRDAALALAAIANRGGSNRSGVDIEIPMGSKLLMARRKAAIGAFKGSKNQAAAAFRLSRRTVQRYRSASRDGAGPLFDSPSKQP